jgi:pimeloyl-ACP methyl ester carboxylesterase
MRSSTVLDVGGVRLHFLLAGSGPVLVLLHGWPQSSLCWRYVVEPLAKRYTVVAPDLRGYGRSDKPADGYDKRSMAADVARLLAALGFARATVIGHDRGARVAHRWALDRPDQVHRLVVLDVVPTREMFRRLDAENARGYWAWLLHLQPELPERLIGRDVRGYLEYVFDRWAVNRAGLDQQTIDAYVRAMERPGAIRAFLADYRAHDTDLALDEADYSAGRRVAVPVLALWGSDGLAAHLPVLDIWRQYADEATGEPIPDCGHFIPEECPGILLRHLQDFLEGAAE